MTDTDMLGTALTPVEQECMRAYDMLKELAARDDLPPCASRTTLTSNSSSCTISASSERG